MPLTSGSVYFSVLGGALHGSAAAARVLGCAAAAVAAAAPFLSLRVAGRLQATASTPFDAACSHPAFAC